MRKILVLGCLLASCAAPPPPKESDGVREAFQDWVRAAVDGNPEKTFELMTAGYKSEWVYRLLETDDPAARRWRGQLGGEARTQLDLWWGIVHAAASGRGGILPPVVLDSPSFFKLYKDYFVQAAGEVRAQFARIQIAQIFSDDTGATVTAKLTPTASPIYCGFKFEDGFWKLDSVIESASRRR